MIVLLGNDFMVSSFFKKYMNVSDSGSFITKLRLKRVSLFNEIISNIQPPVKILDIGGTVNFWEKMGFAGDENYEIIVLNMSLNESGYSNIKTVVGDARDLRTYSSNQFDVVFSNSVIEHVGTYEDQQRMAEEVQRVGRRYFVQTPNYYFPFEPHFLFPFFQFFPLQLKALLIQNFNLGWRKRCPKKSKAIECAKSVKLLSKKEIQELFPSSNIYEEKMFMVTYSLIAYR